MPARHRTTPGSARPSVGRRRCCSARRPGGERRSGGAVPDLASRTGRTAAPSPRRRTRWCPQDPPGRAVIVDRQASPGTEQTDALAPASSTAATTDPRPRSIAARSSALTTSRKYRVTPSRWVTEAVLRRSNPAAVRTASAPRASVGQAERSTEPFGHETVHEARDAAPGEQDPLREDAHPQAAAGGIGELQQRVVLRQRDAVRGLQLLVQGAPEQARVRLDQGPPGAKPGVGGGDRDARGGGAWAAPGRGRGELGCHGSYPTPTTN